MPNLLSTGHLCCTRNLGIALLCLWALPVAGAEAPAARPGSPALAASNSNATCSNYNWSSANARCNVAASVHQRSHRPCQQTSPRMNTAGPLSGTRLAGVTLFSRAQLNKHIEPYVGALHGRHADQPPAGRDHPAVCRGRLYRQPPLPDQCARRRETAGYSRRRRLPGKPSNWPTRACRFH